MWYDIVQVERRTTVLIITTHIQHKMEFESPDVEKDFPGLYASESGGKKSNESDCK